jgi:hypothetical protein
LATGFRKATPSHENENANRKGPQHVLEINWRRLSLL